MAVVCVSVCVFVSTYRPTNCVHLCVWEQSFCTWVCERASLQKIMRGYYCLKKSFKEILCVSSSLCYTVPLIQWGSPPQLLWRLQPMNRFVNVCIYFIFQPFFPEKLERALRSSPTLLFFIFTFLDTFRVYGRPVKPQHLLVMTKELFWMGWGSGGVPCSRAPFKDCCIYSLFWLRFSQPSFGLPSFSGLDSEKAVFNWKIHF